MSLHTFPHQAACRAAVDHCKGKGKNISKLALQYSLANTDISSVLVGMKSVKEVIFFNRHPLPLILHFMTLMSAYELVFSSFLGSDIVYYTFHKKEWLA